MTGPGVDPVGRKSCGSRCRSSSTACTLTAVGDSPSPITIAQRARGDADGPRATAATRIEHTSEIGPAQIVAAARAPGSTPRRRDAEAGQVGRNPADIKSGVNGIAGTGVIEREREQRTGRQAGAGAAETDPRRRQRRADRQAKGTLAPAVSSCCYSAGTDASRSRIE